MSDETGITLAQAKSMLAKWLAADAAVATGQAYSIDNVSVTRADARTITDKIKFYSAVVQGLSRGGPRVRRVIPRSM